MSESWIARMAGLLAHLIPVFRDIIAIFVFRYFPSFTIPFF